MGQMGFFFLTKNTLPWFFSFFTGRQGEFKVICLSGRVNLSLSLTFIGAERSNSAITALLHPTKTRGPRFPWCHQRTTPQYFVLGNQVHFDRIQAHICSTWSDRRCLCCYVVTDYDALIIRSANYRVGALLITPNYHNNTIRITDPNV